MTITMKGNALFKRKATSVTASPSQTAVVKKDQMTQVLIIFFYMPHIYQHRKSAPCFTHSSTYGTIVLHPILDPSRSLDRPFI